MGTKKGNKLHEKGNMLPFSVDAPCVQAMYAAALAAVLRDEVSGPGISAKTIMRWTGASERAVKGWLRGERGPSGEHLIGLIANSDAVAAAVFRLARREMPVHAQMVARAREHLRAAIVALGSIAD